MKQTLKNIVSKIGLAGPIKEMRRYWRYMQPAQIAKRKRARHRHLDWIRFYSQFLKQGELCFDVGANVGDRTQVFHELGATVVAVEPHKLCLEKLQQRFARADQVHIIAKGLGAQAGTHEFIISSDIETSSMSPEWIASIQARLGDYTWQKTEQVELTTLDNLIEQFGLPAFCKIDVEGFEYQVLQGLSQPIPAISFEYTPEFIQAAVDCLHHLAFIGTYEFNYSKSISREWGLPQWASEEEMLAILRTLPQDQESGDIYARLLP